MIKHKAGLHKDVAKIFETVWTPRIDNIQHSVSTVYRDTGTYMHPKPLATDNWPEKARKPKKPIPSSNPWSFLSPKARREKKRLSEISKNLLINLPD